MTWPTGNGSVERVRVDPGWAPYSDGEMYGWRASGMPALGIRVR